VSELAVSVIVPARNAERSLPALLDALDRQRSGRPAFETIVADDASNDRTAAVARAAGARVVSMARRGGSYAARNLALAEARADVLVFVDADCVPGDGWLEHGLADLERLGADILGGRVEPRLGPDPKLVEMIDLARCLDQELCVNDAGYAATANVFVRRRVFDSIGPFNGALVSGGDVEFSLRATEAGFRLAYSDGAAVFHPVRARALQLVKKGLRTGFGSGQWEHVAAGPLRAHRATWRSRASYRPDRGILHYGRAGRLGAAVTSGRGRTADLAHYALLQLPRVVGSLAASARRGRPPFRP
jgi:glycosyltransferase involved in cell wall biosynthesis